MFKLQKKQIIESSLKSSSLLSKIPQISNVLIMFVIATCMFNSCGDKEESEPRYLSKPEQISAQVNGKSIIISWKAVENADGYEVYRSQPSVDDGYSHIATTFSASYVDNYPVNGTNYYYVCPFNEEMGEYSDGASVQCEYNGGSGGDVATAPSAPTGVTAAANSSSSITVSWSSVSNATGYYIYCSSSSSGSYTQVGNSSSTSYSDTGLSASTTYYYKVAAYNSAGTSSQSSSTSATTQSGSSGTTRPSAPTGVTASNVGSAMIPEIRISWNSVSNATSYKVYRSSSASGTYSQISSSTTYTQLSDFNPLNGNNYYKVTAINSAGESSQSSAASYNHNPSANISPCPVIYGNCTVSGTTITMRWTNPTTTGCGTPTKAILRVKSPYNNNYADVETLSGNATSTSFNYGPWANSDGYVYVGIITENTAGSSGGTPKVYDSKNKKWIN